MKRHLLFALLIVFILADGFGSLFRPAPSTRPDAAPPPADCGIQSVGERAFSFAARQLASVSWLRRPTEPLQLVPQDALLMIDAANTAAAAKAFAASEFAEALRSADWPAVLPQPELAEGISQLQQEAAAFFAHPLTQELFSRRAVLALLNPAEPIPQDGSSQQFWLEHLLLIAQPAPDSIASLLKSEAWQTVWHQGVAVQLFDVNEDKTLHVASVGGLLLISPGLRPVQTGIDLFLRSLFRKQTGLPLNPDYAAVKAAASGKDDFFLHADISRIATLLGLPAPLRSFGLLHRQDGRIDRFTAVAHFAPDHPPGGWAMMPPAQNRSLRRMPAGLLLHFWSNWLLPGCWLEAVPTQEDELAAADAWLRQKSGFGLDETLGLFGREFSFVVSGISTDGLLPVPRLSLLAEVTDQGKAERFLGWMTSGLPVKREAASGVPVVSLQAAKGLMQPSYAFADRLLLLADSREQIADILSDTAPKLTSSPLFQDVNTGLDQPANLTLFARPAQLAEGLKGLAAWAEPLLAAHHGGTAADQLLPPLLAGLRRFEAAGLRSVVRLGELRVDAALQRASR